VIVGTSDTESELPTILKQLTEDPFSEEFSFFRQVSELPTHTETDRKLDAQVCDFVSLLDG
jgi:hypothetical protein